MKNQTTNTAAETPNMNETPKVSFWSKVKGFIGAVLTGMVERLSMILFFTAYLIVEIWKYFVKNEIIIVISSLTLGYYLVSPFFLYPLSVYLLGVVVLRTVRKMRN